MTISIDPSQLDLLLTLIRKIHPGWQNFDNPDFVEHEISYKRKAAAQMQNVLSHSEFERLLDGNEIDEIVKRLERLTSTGMLYLSTPQSGDLRILYTDTIDRGKLCRELFHLLYDKASIQERFQRYLDFVNQYDSKFNYWTFPTYFLFLAHPEREFFVKPNVTKKYLKWFGLAQEWTGKPSVNSYVKLLELAKALEEKLQPYGAHDFIDVQSFLWAAIGLNGLNRETFDEIMRSKPLEDIANDELAAPFSEIFQSKSDALWAFDLLADALHRLGIHDPNDERFAITMPTRKRRCLHLNFCSWLVLGFQDNHLRIAFQEGSGVDEKYVDYDFKQKPAEKPIKGYRIPYAMVQPMPEAWQTAYNETLALLAELFHTTTRSRYRQHHVAQVAAAVFDPSLRASLLSEGIEGVPEFVHEEASAANILNNLPEAVDDCPFSRATFDLLAQLHANPTSEFYLAHKEEFVHHVEEPFKRVLLEVGRRLPTAIREVMETEKRIFARILKNDWGQGGAWDFYWGAFYPKGSKRTTGVQLLMGMDYRRVQINFFLGAYAIEQRARFQRNCERYATALAEIMDGLFEDGEIFLGSRDKIEITSDGTVDYLVRRSWSDFLSDPSANNCEASSIISAVGLLSLSYEELVARVVYFYERLFPLILASLEENPMPAIGAYLEPLLEGPEDGEEVFTQTEPSEPPIPYTTADFERETSLPLAQMTDLLELLKYKKQLILQGPPGTGKTFVAQRLARLLTGLAQPGQQLQTIQFHPAYGYEDFMEGIRPESRTTPSGQQIVEYPVLPGRFREFCERAARHDVNEPFVFIIDEINRGNLPRIFGELMYLLEYRDESVTLPYSGRQFQIPPNVYLIGTMNTADRSIALVDFALRRRFAFFSMMAEPDLFDRWLQTNACEVSYLGHLYRRLSQEAIDDANYQIGPSYFMQPGLTETMLARIWRYNIEPLLKEYYAENAKKAAEWDWDGELVSKIRREQ